jgi:hypothetical protein
VLLYISVYTNSNLKITIQFDLIQIEFTNIRNSRIRSQPYQSALLPSTPWLQELKTTHIYIILRPTLMIIETSSTRITFRQCKQCPPRLKPQVVLRAQRWSFQDPNSRLNPFRRFRRKMKRAIFALSVWRRIGFGPN